MMKTCWDCQYIRLGGICFPAKCGWFESKNKEAREIPVSVIDNGCKFFKEKHVPIDIERITDD